MENITIRDLRKILFNVKNQDLTVAELRRKLYDEEDQEFEINEITCRKLAQY